MRTPPRILAVLLITSIVVGCASTVGRRAHGIDNFATVEPGFYRGGQPGNRGLEELAQQGVATIINLRDDPVAGERAKVEGLGMTYIEIGTDAALVSPAKINQFLQQATSAPRPIFVHCRAGRDRTGLEIAMYRIVVRGWTRERAIGELYAHGYNWMLYPGIARYLKNYPSAARQATTSGG